VPADITVLDPVNQKIKITVRGLRKDASTIKDEDVKAEIDLSLARMGKTIFQVSRRNIFLPNERVEVVNIEPSRIEFSFKEGK
jgi:hypothetical protein